MDGMTRSDYTKLVIEEEDEDDGCDDTLMDSFPEEVADVATELERVRSRIGVLKAFHHHLQLAQLPCVRQELEAKVEGETNIIAASLKQLADIFRKWRGETRPKNDDRLEEENKATERLKDVVQQYDQVLSQCKDAALAKLKETLRGSNAVPDVSQQIVGVDKLHQEAVEEHYTQLLKTENYQRILKNNFPFFFNLEEESSRVAVQILKPTPVPQRTQIQATLSRTVSVLPRVATI